MGIDANGQVGRDAEVPWAGPAGGKTWTPNGEQLQITAREGDLVITNTLHTTENPGWTWQSRDEKHRNRIDYILISRKMMAHVKKNVGATDALQTNKEGNNTDHRPVMIHIALTSLGGENHMQQQPKQTRTNMPTQEMKEDFIEYTKAAQGELMKDPPELNARKMERIQQFQNTVREEIQKGTETAEAIKIAVQQHYPQRTKRPKAPWMDTETMENVNKQAGLWAQARTKGQQLGKAKW